jgi:asparagine synthetase B (glutamine-hydrolysing)
MNNALCELFTFGYILGNKTLTKKIIPEINIEYEIKRKQTNWKDVYKALENAVLTICQENNDIAMLLSGGMDSRIIAGIIAKNKINIPFYTLDILKRETKISKKISDIFDLNQRIIPVSEEQMISLSNLREISVHTKGTLNIPYFMWRSNTLKQINKPVLSGLYGTELLAEDIHLFSSDVKRFCVRLYDARCKVQTLKSELNNLFEYCKNVKSKARYYETYIKSRARIETQCINGKQVFSPFLDSDVLTAVFSLPPEDRFKKKVNYQIVKNIFPKLKNVDDVTPINPIRRKIKQVFKLGNKRTIDFDRILRKKPYLIEYIRRGTPRLSSDKIVSRLIQGCYSGKSGFAKPLFYFLSNYFLREQDS